MIVLYGLGLAAATLRWGPAGMLCGFAAFMGFIISAEDSAALGNRCVRLLPLSQQELTLIRWARVFLTPLVLVGVPFLVLLAATDSPRRTAVIALYVVGPCAIPLLTSTLKQTRRVATASMVAALILLLFSVYNFARDQISATFVVINVMLLVIGLSYPIWARLTWRANRFRLPVIRTRRLGTLWPRGVLALIWLQIRSTVPFILATAAFALIVGLLQPSIYADIAQTIVLLSSALMCFMWMSNIRWLQQFRVLRCLPLSSATLTLLTIGATAIPTSTIYVIQYSVVTLFFSGQSTVALESLIAVLAIQTLSVPLLVRRHWVWIAGLINFPLFRMQMVLVGIDFSSLPPWIEFRPVAWSMGFFWILTTCALVGLTCTYHEIRGGRRAYRVQPNEQMASSEAS
jgi:hypothetical protein